MCIMHDMMSHRRLYAIIFLWAYARMMCCCSSSAEPRRGQHVSSPRQDELSQVLAVPVFIVYGVCELPTPYRQPQPSKFPQPSSGSLRTRGGMP